MHWRAVFVLPLCLLGCEATPPPLPPVAPPLEDLSVWTVPEIVQPVPQQGQAALTTQERPTPAERVFPFIQGTTFTVQVALDAPLDVLLERGEQVRNIVGGSVPAEPTPQPVIPGTPQAPHEPTVTARWEAKEGVEGEGETARSHVFLAATSPGLSTGLIITTTRRTYYLTCKSVKTSPVRVVRWTYPEESQGKALQSKEPGLLPDPALPAHYHAGYSIASTGGTTPSWLPRQVVDDGKKTYILYPEVALFDTVPVVRLVGPNGPQIVNARQFLNVVILDQLAARMELRVGIGEQAETVSITRGALRTIRCPEDGACPHWPSAAQVLARRVKP